jgi:hypothetical protein
MRQPPPRPQGAARWAARLLQANATDTLHLTSFKSGSQNNSLELESWAKSVYINNDFENLFPYCALGL